jgi:hypothetical protein
MRWRPAEVLQDFSADVLCATPSRRKRTKSASHLKSMIGVTCTVAVKKSGEVPRSQGKAVRVKEMRKTKN